MRPYFEQMNTGGALGIERLPHFKHELHEPSSGQEIQTEFFVPFDRGYEQYRAV